MRTRYYKTNIGNLGILKARNPPRSHLLLVNDYDYSVLFGKIYSARFLLHGWKKLFTREIVWGHRNGHTTSLFAHVKRNIHKGTKEAGFCLASTDHVILQQTLVFIFISLLLQHYLGFCLIYLTIFIPIPIFLQVQQFEVVRKSIIQSVIFMQSVLWFYIRNWSYLFLFNNDEKGSNYVPMWLSYCGYFNKF